MSKEKQPFNKRIIRFFIAIALIAVSSLLPLLAGEFLIRKINVESEKLIQEDPYLGWSHIPNARGLWYNKEFTNYVKINSKGLNDLEYPYKKEKDVFRIIIVGDSMTESFQVPLEKTFIKLLEKKLNKQNNRKFEVINCGVRGYGTYNELLYLKKECLKYNPDLVILGFYPCNDIKDNSYKLSEWTWDGRFRSSLIDKRPYFLLEEGKLKLHNYPVKSIIEAKKHKTSKKKYWGETPGVRGFLKDNSALYRFSVNLVRMRMSGMIKFLSDYGIVSPNASVRKKGKVYGGYYPSSYDVYRKDVQPEWKEAWKLTFALIKEMQSESAAKNSKFMVLTLTSREEISKVWEQTKDTYPLMNNFKWDVGQPMLLTERFLKKNNIPFSSMRPYFLKEKNRENLFYYFNAHLTSAGHKVVADSLFSFLEKSPLIIKLH